MLVFWCPKGAKHKKEKKMEPQKTFQIIPGVGKSLSQKLIDLGYREVEDLKGQNPEEMYENLMKIRGCHIDRCVLYVFRSAVYFAENTEYDPELLKWWNWKDDKE